MAILKNTKINSTGAFTLPTGTVAQRTALTSTVQSFTNTGPGTFNVPTGVKFVDVLIVAGGGGGANSLGGGGGGGGLIEARNLPVTPGSTIPVVVGAGGAAAPAAPQYIPGSPGQNSSFGSIVAYGGGAGAGYSNPPAGAGNPSQVGTYVNHGFRGGSGGGGGGTEGQWSGKGESEHSEYSSILDKGIVAWGYPGGSGWGPGPVGHAGGGGGGAGEEGSPATPTTGGKGGSGRVSEITGSRVYYAGGGGGGSHSPGTFTTIPGGNGGGGRGGGGATGGLPGTTNTGGGGGCGGYYNVAPGAGGPGVVIVRYVTETTSSDPFQGALRWNSTLSRSEIFNGGVWEPLRPKTVQSFTATGPGTFSVPTGITSVEVLVVGGGGSAGNIAGGGGGGGVVYHANYPVTPGGTVSYSVGAGGTSGPAYPGPAGTNGTPSTFGVITAYGGGASGSWSSGPPGGTVGSGAGGPGTPGIGNDGGIAQQPRSTNGDIGATNYGNPGCRGGTNGPQGSDYGMNTGSGQYSGGGGGGAGRSGGYRSYIVNIESQSVNNIGRNHIHQVDAGRDGGDGVAFDISGSWVYYGGGGAGGAHSPGYNQPGATARGGLGGGGNGASVDIQFAPAGRGQPGGTNTGGGGGGGYYTGGGTSQGGNGGPGIIIVRY
jgi:hypothetical protein